MTENKTCKSKICPKGFGWNDETVSCEDVTCKIANCIKCEDGNLVECNQCEAGYIYNEQKKICFLDTCQVENCQSCDDDHFKCDTCAYGFWLDNNKCISDTCSDSKCDTCYTAGPSHCDFCEHNFILKDNKCSNSACEQSSHAFSFNKFECIDTTCTDAQCAKCEISGVDGCDKCNTGYTYDEDNNACKPDESCAMKACDDCEANRDSCTKCDDGYDNLGSMCISTRCTELGCLKCDDPNVCQEC